MPSEPGQRTLLFKQLTPYMLRVSAHTVGSPATHLLDVLGLHPKSPWPFLWPAEDHHGETVTLRILRLVASLHPELAGVRRRPDRTTAQHLSAVRSRTVG